ncbi:hypothetical protein Tco_1369343 [Tanacetum coccineum]
MPRATSTDISLTKSYIPKVSKIPGISPTIAKFYKSIENRNIHEGRVVDQAYYKSNNIKRSFTIIRFGCLLNIQQTDCSDLFLILSSSHDLASLEYSQETEGPYSIDLPTPDDIHRLLELERVMEAIGTISLVGLLTCFFLLFSLLYCVVAEVQLHYWAYFFVKRIKCARANPTANLPYGMFLDRLYRQIMGKHSSLDKRHLMALLIDSCVPLLLNKLRDLEVIMARHAIPFSSSSSHHHSTSSHQHDDDDDDVETSRASTPSPTTYLNSLNPLNYQNYEMPSASEQTDETLFERQTTLLNQTQQMHKEMRGGFKSFGKALKGVFSKKKK